MIVDTFDLFIVIGEWICREQSNGVDEIKQFVRSSLPNIIGDDGIERSFIILLNRLPLFIDDLFDVIIWLITYIK
jgi:hypothetical protein